MSGNLRNTLKQIREAQDDNSGEPVTSPHTVNQTEDQMRQDYAMPEPAPQQPQEPTTRYEEQRGRPRTGKRSDPSYERLTALVRKETRKQVDLRMVQDPSSPQDLSELVEMLLSRWGSGYTA